VLQLADRADFNLRGGGGLVQVALTNGGQAGALRMSLRAAFFSASLTHCGCVFKTVQSREGQPVTCKSLEEIKLSRPRTSFRARVHHWALPRARHQRQQLLLTVYRGDGASKQVLHDENVVVKKDPRSKHSKKTSRSSPGVCLGEL